MEKNKKDNNKSWVLVTVLIVALLITTALGGYFVGALKFTSSMIKEQKEVNKEVAEKETVEPEKEVEEEVKSPYRTCVGTYKGTGPISIDVQTKKTTSGEYALSLKEDGTFEYSTGQANEKGYYVIMDNTLVFMNTKHTTGPEDKDPSIVTATYVISKDCSKILFDSVVSQETVNLVRQ
ncbi:MAG: hypothetical protein IJI58_01295 [Bacilli bacterium]|nr:hypothetical protein [Bacilli bacterium]